MRTRPLTLRARDAARPCHPAQPLLASANLSRPYFPARGVPYSLLIHGIVFLVLVTLRVAHGPTGRFTLPERATVIKSDEPRVVMFLPILGGGSQGMGQPGGGPKGRGKATPVVAASSRKGLSYPGRQPIVSDVPNPTNRIQTLLQPALRNPPVLQPPLSLPNIVQIADAGPALESPTPVVRPPAAVQPPEPTPPPPEVKPAEPAPPPIEVAPPPSIDTPKLVLPNRVPEDSLPEPKPPPSPPMIEPQLPTKPPPPVEIQSPPKESPQEVPQKPVEEERKPEPPTRAAEGLKESPKPELSPVPTRGADLHNIVALTPMPAVRELPFEVPPGEARGRFAISPDPNLATTETEPGSKLEVPPATTGIGSQTAAPIGSGAAGSPAPATGITIGASAGPAKDGNSPGGGTGHGSGTGSGRGSGAGAGSGTGAGSGPGAGSGRGPGAGSGSGPGSGSGSGTGSGPGSGAGSGPGKGAFSGITIVGGGWDTGAASDSPPRTRTPRPLQTAYGISIISTEDSGGGLPDFGVFEHAQIHTVFLDMRETEIDTAPSWTLEIAVLPGAASTRPNEDASRGQQGLVLPFPVVKERPALPAEVVRKYLQLMIIAYAIINVEGRMEQVSVKESPDPLLNEPILSALRKWVFRPARLNGEPVATKILLGIPLWLPE